MFWLSMTSFLLTASLAATSFAGSCAKLSSNSKSFLSASNSEKTVSEILKTAEVQINGPENSDITIKDPKFFRRILSDPTFELGETYMDGMWNSPAIDQLTTKLYLAQARDGNKLFAPLWRTPGLALIAIIKHQYRYYRDLFTNRQTRVRSTTVAKEHYDAGNELYRLMLDPSLTYTSGIWSQGYSLEDAQNAKYDLIARKLNLKPGQHILDIGSGFGGFARFAAKYYGVRVTGITISIEQLKLAKALSTGMKDVDFVYSDYRDIPNRFPPNTFDHIVSIEMIEAVGPKNLKNYFQAASSSLKNGGRFLIQAIASNVDVVNSNPWFSKYIFQDGVAPSTDQVDKAAKSNFGAPADRHQITEHYDKTLLAWHTNFTKTWPQLKVSYTERFKRMWDFYLLSVAGGFRSKTLQLYQTVYVKGGPQHQMEPIRDLPTRTRLDSMKISEKEKDLTAKTVADLEKEKRAVEEALKPRAQGTNTPLPKDALVAIIGGGPSGLSSALELKRLGYKNVTVFERASEAGGKSHTQSFEGRPHDLGATMGVRLKYAEIIRLAKLHGQNTIPFPKEVDYNLESGQASKAPTWGQNLRKKFQGLLYLIHWIKMAGFNGYKLEVPSAELADPWLVVMNRNGLGYFGGLMKTYLTGYGYGGPETPAIFGERMLDAKAIFGAAVSTSVMWENGTQPIWKGVASDLNVRPNAEVDRIQRGEDGVNIYLKGSRTPKHFDKLIVAVDPATALKILDATPEEQSLFSQVKYMPYSTFAVRVENFSDGRSEVGYLRENMTLDRQGHPMAWIKRYADDNVFIFHLFAPNSMPDGQIMQNIKRDMQRLGAGQMTLLASHRWPFFPHVDSASMRENRFYERVANLQGKGHTVFSNEALGMSTMPDASQLGKKVAQRLATGEY